MDLDDYTNNNGLQYCGEADVKGGRNRKEEEVKVASQW